MRLPIPFSGDNGSNIMVIENMLILNLLLGFAIHVNFLFGLVMVGIEREVGVLVELVGQWDVLYYFRVHIFG